MVAVNYIQAKTGKSTVACFPRETGKAVSGVGKILGVEDVKNYVRRKVR